MEPLHKENSKTKLTTQKDKDVHSFKQNVHSSVKCSSHDFVDKRSLHKLETMSCVYTNADCLTNKMGELRLLARNHKPTIIGITEVKPKNSRYDLADAEIAIDGYEMFGCNLRGKAGRGVALYIKNTIQANPVEFTCEFSESVWLSTKLVGGDKLLVGCIYRSSNGTDENNQNLLKLLSEVGHSKYSHVLITGDFNFEKIDWSNWHTPSSESSIDFKFIEKIRDCYLFQHVTKPTRARIDHEPHILDLILSNEEGMVSDIEYCSPLGKSDHSLITFNFNCYIQQENMERTKYYYDKANFQGMRNELSTFDWENEMQNKDVNEKWSVFKERLLSIQDKYVPKRKPRTTSDRKGKCSIDLKTLKTIRKKHRCWARYMETRDAERYREYCKLRNQVKTLTRKAVKSKEKEIASEIKENPKKFWSYVNSKTKTRTGISDLVMNNDNNTETLTSNDKEKADTLSAFFSSVFTVESNDNYPNLDDPDIEHTMPALIITEEMVQKRLHELNISKSPGPDGIHPRILHDLSEVLCKPVKLIFEHCISTSTLPDEWREGCITAIFKKGSRKSASNYRPVSLTCILCKQLETFVRDHVVDHMRKNSLFSNKQFGFISGRSTSLQLLHVLERWTQILDAGGSLDCIYLDFMKAFDKVPHRRLIYKLQHYGISNSIIQWIESFLSDRKQRVRVMNSFSEYTPVTSGIPQGSVLGPILFVVYINDLPDKLNSECYMFADDTKVYREINSPSDNNLLQEDMNSLEEWSDDWLLRFHPDKCKVLSLGKKSTPADYSLCNTKLQATTKEKDIGVVIDNKLTFEDHINEKINKANSIMGLIRRSFTYMDNNIFLHLYKSLVRPHLEYANSVWSPYKKKHTTAIENVQRRATKLLPGMSDLSYEDRLRKLKLPSLKYRRIRGDMIETYKLTSGIYDTALPSLLTFNTSSTTRGHSKKLYLHRSSKDIRKYFFTNRVVNMWNSLSEHVVSAKNTKIFESRLDRLWGNQGLLFNYEGDIITGCDTNDYGEDIDEDLSIVVASQRSEEDL